MENSLQVVYRRIAPGAGGLAEISLNRPDKGNALTLEMLSRLDQIIREIRADRDVRVVVLRGAGRFFCTGGDIKEWGAMTPHQMAEDWILPGIEVFNSLAALPQPAVAVLQGHTFGGGLELALAADIRIASPNVTLGNPEVRLGMVAGWGGVRRLAETIGVSRARYLALTGLPISAKTALDWGLIHQVSSSAETLDEEASAIVDGLLKNGPIAMQVTKGLLATMHQDLRYAHAAAVSQVSGTEDCREGTAAFREKRAPIFHKR